MNRSSPIYPNLAGIAYESIVDGTGVRTAIFLSGCTHHCYDCHNLEAQNPNFGTQITDEMIDQIADNIVKRPYISGITLTGGDPFFWPENTLNFLRSLLAKILQKDGRWVYDRVEPVWCYTGYKYEELPKTNAVKAMIGLIDVLVDGLFVKALADKRLAFRGSSNQRIIHLHHKKEIVV